MPTYAQSQGLYSDILSSVITHDSQVGGNLPELDTGPRAGGAKRELRISVCSNLIVDNTFARGIT